MICDLEEKDIINTVKTGSENDIGTLKTRKLNIQNMKKIQEEQNDDDLNKKVKEHLKAFA